MSNPTKKHPLYIQISDDLKVLIQQGHYKKGSFLPPERILSEKYKVERMTLRKALSVLVKENYIQKLPGVGNKVTYVQQSSPDKGSFSNSIVYVLPDMNNANIVQPYHMEICYYLEEYCKHDGLDLQFTRVSSSQPTLSFLSNPSLVKGVIWVGNINEGFLDTARELGIPSISVVNTYPHFPKINIDDINCSYDATKHLIERGCRNILHITGLADYMNTRDRTEGYLRAIEASHLPCKPELILNGDWCFEGSYSDTLDFIQKGIEFDGIMASNDMMALGAMKAVLQSGLSVPKDVKIIGIDNIQQSNMSTPSLTTIAVEQKSIAQTAYIFLKQLMAGISVPNEILIPGNLIQRETT